ncbi:hypothetical protein PLESTB_001533400 [Pleodorina starrii]|uniref:Uncharacterized protein n=1 Tax=Pleodorina starrii TaxID=330485 RepID=A0A9W6BYB4_9CHLO|nr:hypothetical protein PLESTM_001838900 [Pleodorina starrii]GLC59766.1 hypothetical protein PLESTB_001533400 [Pleodorina starrii]GLC67351.1 hypothetical protein PLESTF_000545400 [Pleodorina starrii]
MANRAIEREYVDALDSDDVNIGNADRAKGDPQANTVNDTYQEADYLEMCRLLMLGAVAEAKLKWDKLKLVQAQLAVLLLHAGVGRSDDSRIWHLADIGQPLFLQGVGPCLAACINIAPTGGKVPRKDGRGAHTGFIRAASVITCPMRALAETIVVRFLLLGEPFPDPRNMDDWLGRPLLRSARSMRKGVACKSQWEAISEPLSKHPGGGGFCLPKVLPAMRPGGAPALDTQGEDLDDIGSMGRRVQDSVVRSYLQGQPIEALLAVAGFKCAGREQLQTAYWAPRFMFGVEEAEMAALKEVVFPFLPDLRTRVAEVAQQPAGRDAPTSLVPAVLKAMEYLAEVAVQDSFELAFLAPENPIVLVLAENPCWQRLKARFWAEYPALCNTRPLSIREQLADIQAGLQVFAMRIGSVLGAVAAGGPQANAGGGGILAYGSGGIVGAGGFGPGSMLGGGGFGHGGMPGGGAYGPGGMLGGGAYGHGGMPGGGAYGPGGMPGGGAYGPGGMPGGGAYGPGGMPGGGAYGPGGMPGGGAYGPGGIVGAGGFGPGGMLGGGAYGPGGSGYGPGLGLGLGFHTTPADVGNRAAAAADTPNSNTNNAGRDSTGAGGLVGASGGASAPGSGARLILLERIQDISTAYHDGRNGERPWQWMEQTHGTKWRTGLKRWWYDTMEIIRALHETARIRECTIPEATEFWQQVQDKKQYSRDKMRTLIQYLAKLGALKDYVSRDRRPDFVSPGKVPRRPQANKSGGGGGAVSGFGAESGGGDGGPRNTLILSVESGAHATPPRTADAAATTAGAVSDGGGGGTGGALGAAGGGGGVSIAGKKRGRQEQEDESRPKK